MATETDLEKIKKVVNEEVLNAKVIDVHTHLFPPSHGELFQWGVDKLLNYHYIVSEYFMTTGSVVSFDDFFNKLSEEERSDRIWEELFVKRTPISEACQGVIRVLSRLGLEKYIYDTNLYNIRAWFRERKKGDPNEYVRKIFDLAGIKYVFMTNIPFLETETVHWHKSTNEVKKETFDTDLFKAALRVDQLLTADWTTLSRSIFNCEKKDLPKQFDSAEAKSNLLSKVFKFLEEWALRIDAVYLFASTPADFTYDPLTKSLSTELPNSSELIDHVLLPLARKLKLPIGLKVGAVRGVNPDLCPCGGGDGVEVADTKFLQVLCKNNPDIKFLVTFLSRNNQHEACVIANKFRNCHLYGCWWYCNNPSIIQEITDMRMEMLGTNFTAQHSDARVLDQLIYKWDHSRSTIGKCLIKRYIELAKVGYLVTDDQIKRDVHYMLGGSFEQFMEK